MSERPIRLRPLSHGTAAFLGRVTEVRVDNSLPTCAVAVVDGEVIFLAGLAYTRIPDYGTDPAEDARQADADYAREQLIRHEAHHCICEHPEREQGRDHELWNLVTDACIHHQTSIDLDSIRASVGGEIVTFEGLDIRALPPEFAYELLKDREQRRGGEGDPTGGIGRFGGGCGRPTDEDIRARTAPKDRHGQPKPETPVEQEETKAARRQLRQDVIEGLQEDRADGDTSVPETLGKEPESNEGGPEGTGGRGGKQEPGTTPPWIDEVLNQLEMNGPKVDRGRTYRREHRECDLLPGRGRVRGVVATIMVDASGSIRREDLDQLLGALASTRFGESNVYVHDTKCYGPVSAADISGIQELVKLCGGGTRIAGSWDQIKDQVDPQHIRVWFTDGEDGYRKLPEPWAGDIWIYVPWRGKIEVLDRVGMDKKRGH